MPLANEAFTDNVRRFCQWVESGTHDLETARQLLLALMQGIPFLTVSEAQDDEPQYPQRDYEGWKADYQRFSDFPFQYYREVYSPCKLDDEPPLIGDVHDDFADIYGELWHGLQAWDRGDAVYAISYWRDSYFRHWGHHASSAIHALDEYYRNMKNAEEDAALEDEPPPPPATSDGSGGGLSPMS